MTFAPAGGLRWRSVNLPERLARSCAAAKAMRDVIYAPAFRKDRRRVAKRGKDLERLIAVVTQLAEFGQLSATNRPHKLGGEFEGWWECHIERDWLLIYAVTPDCVTLFRTGSHTDLFK